MRRFLSLYIAVGVALVILAVFFGSPGLDQKDLALYRQASEMKGEDFWPGLDITDYPVAIRSGNREYVIRNGKVASRKPALPVLAATAYRVEGQVNVFLPAKKEMESLGNIMEGMMSGGETLVLKGFSMSSEEVPDERYMAFLYHETLHGYQIQNYEGPLFQQIPKDYDERSMLELITEIDKNEKLRNLYLAENKALYKAVTSQQDTMDKEDSEDTKDMIEKYLALREARNKELSKHFEKDEIQRILWLEAYYEKVEGTARYVEAKVLMALGEKALYNQYIESLKNYSDGKEKYYQSGMGISFILDELQEEWKTSVFNQPETMHEILKETMGKE